MLTLKPLDELTQPDPLNERRSALDSRYKIMAALELSERVPEDIREAFAVSRNLWLYGWFYWPFYTVASFHAFTTLEMALYRRCQLEKIQMKGWPKDRSPGLKKLLNEAIERKWIHDEEFAHVKRLRESRLRCRPDCSKEQDAPAPEPWGTLNQKYCRILAEVIPSSRNEKAHPSHYWHTGADSLDMQNTRDLIEQIFSKQEK